MLQDPTASIVQTFFLNRECFDPLVRNKSIEDLVGALKDILNLYANDKNSSTLREWVVLRVAGCHQQPGKIGYNGYKDDAPYEVKPRNVRLDERKRRLNGDGNFTDFTYERLEKYLQDGLRVLVAGFVDGNLLYVIEVPMESLQHALRRQLDQKFREGRPAGVFLRGARFSFRDYKDDARVRCLFLHPRWHDYQEYLTGPFRSYLESLARGNGDVPADGSSEHHPGR